MSFDRRSGCSHIPPLYGSVFFDRFDASVGEAAASALSATQAFVRGDVQSVLLSGPPGSGKSMLAAIACNEYAWSIWRVARMEYAALLREARALPEHSRSYAIESAMRLRDVGERVFVRLTCPRWITVPRLLAQLRRDIRKESRDGEEAIEGVLASTGPLVLDDLGSERATEWSLSRLFEVVADRYEKQGQLFVTTNKTKAQLVGAGYERIVSRLAHDGVLLEMRSVPDYRTRLRRTVTSLREPAA